jgi:hypothetical protein
MGSGAKSTWIGRRATDAVIGALKFFAVKRQAAVGPSFTYEKRIPALRCHCVDLDDMLFWNAGLCVMVQFTCAFVLTNSTDDWIEWLDLGRAAGFPL